MRVNTTPNIFQLIKAIIMKEADGGLCQRLPVRQSQFCYLAVAVTGTLDKISKSSLGFMPSPSDPYRGVSLLQHMTINTSPQFYYPAVTSAGKCPAVPAALLPGNFNKIYLQEIFSHLAENFLYTGMPYNLLII